MSKFSPATQTEPAELPVAGPEAPVTTSPGQRGRGVRDSAAGTLVIHVLERYWLLIFLVVEFVFFSIMRPGTFATVANMQTISLQQVEPLIASLALTLPLIVGEFDLAVGTVATGSAVVVSGMMGHSVSTPLALLIAVAGGALVGLILGRLVARFEVNSFIGTLGASTALAGFIDVYTGGLSLNKNISPWLTNLAADRIFGIPTLVVLAAVLAALVWFLLQQTVYGRQLSALGANRRAASLLGLSARSLVTSTFILSGLLAGVAGIVQVSVESGASPSSGGIALVIQAITAVFLGATCFRPGHFNVAGTIVGLFFLAFGVSGLSLIGLAAWVQNVFTGLALIVALALAAAFRRAAI